MQKEYLILAIGLINLALGLFVYLKKRDKRERVHFLALTIIITLWSLSLYFYYEPILLSALDWIKITCLLTVIVIPELICFIIVVSNRTIKEFRAQLIISFLSGIAIISALFVKTLMLPPPRSLTFFLLLFMYGIWGAVILFESSLKNPGAEHLQAMYILVGLGLFITSTIIVYVFSPLITDSTEYFWLGPLFSLFLVSAIAFIITRHHLFEMRAVLMASFVAAMGIILLALPFLVLGLNLKILTTAIFLLFCILGYYLIKTANEESKRREEVEILLTEWEKLARAKDQFSLSLQHHLRTPLVPIKGYLEMILGGAYGREENPVIKEKLIEMKKLVDTLYSLMENLLDIQEIRIGKSVLSLEDCQIENLIEGIVEELKLQAEQKGLYLKFERVSLPKIKLDKKRIREAIWNLVDNAIKYTNRGGVTVRSKIEDEKLKIAISDTGIGMEKEEIEYFLKGMLFERGREAEKLYGLGRGIGLSISIEFIKTHGGKIWAESKGWGKGTTFWIELPIEVEPQ